MDKIYIKNLALKCLIGTKPDERTRRQKVIINVALETDLSLSGKTDRLEDTVNYKTLEKKIVELVENSKFFLLERLADRVAHVCLDDIRSVGVTVNIEKPAGLRYGEGVSVEIRRDRKSSGVNR